MFILDLVWGLVQLALVTGGGLYVYGDYRSGWSSTKRLWGKVESTALRLTGRKEDSVTRANKMVGEFGKGLDEFRRAVAAIEADIQVSEKQSRAEGALAGEYGAVVETALRRGDEKVAALAAEAKVQAEARAQMFAEHVNEQRRVIAIMREELLEQEGNFDVMQTKVATIQVQSQLATTKEKLYGLISEVHVKTGLTPSAELEQMKLDAERRNIQAGVLLGMAKGRNGHQAKQLLRSAKEENILEETRNRLALPTSEPDQEVEVIDDKRVVLVAS